eukprot:11300076-Alexandrium_andersonii.AAC.1
MECPPKQHNSALGASGVSYFGGRSTPLPGSPLLAGSAAAARGPPDWRLRRAAEAPTGGDG